MTEFVKAVGVEGVGIAVLAFFGLKVINLLFHEDKGILRLTFKRLIMHLDATDATFTKSAKASEAQVNTLNAIQSQTESLAREFQRNTDTQNTEHLGIVESIQSNTNCLIQLCKLQKENIAQCNALKCESHLINVAKNVARIKKKIGLDDSDHYTKE